MHTLVTPKELVTYTVLCKSHKPSLISLYFAFMKPDVLGISL